MEFITFPIKSVTTSDLSILLHGVISLPDTASYDNKRYLVLKTNLWSFLEWPFYTGFAV